MTGEQQLEQIYQAIRSVPAGQVASYGLIARVAGLRGRARLIGRVLRQAPADLGLPWHRILRADGKIAFPANSPLFDEQVQSLFTEGVLVRNGRVDMKHFGWDASLDRLLWGPSE